MGKLTVTVEFEVVTDESPFDYKERVQWNEFELISDVRTACDMGDVKFYGVEEAS